MDDADFLRQALALAGEALADDEGGPFGAVVVREGRVLGRGRNRVLGRRDPTAHAEVEAIREACRALGTHSLEGCVLYATCEPCPMCLGAVLWSRVDRLVYAADRRDAAAIGFDDAAFYEEVDRPPQERRTPTTVLLREEARGLMRRWAARPDRRTY